MGLFDSIGRSNTMSNIGSDLLKGAQGLVQTQLQMQHQATLEANQQREYDLKKAAADRETEKYQQEQARINTPYNLRYSDLMSIYEPDSSEYVNAFDRLRALTGADQYGNTTVGNYEKGKQVVATDQALMKEITERRKAQLEDSYFKLSQDLDKAKTIGDADKVAKLAPQVEALNKRLVMVNKNWADYAIAQEKHQRELQNKTHKGSDVIDGKTVQVFEDKKGGIFYQTQPGEFIPYTPTSQYQPITAPRESINDFSVFYRGQKEKNPNITEAEISKAWHDQKVKEAEASRSVFATMPTNTPGISFERKTGRYFKTDAAGKKEYLTSSDVKNERLKFIEDQPASNIKTMKQAAPHVLTLVDSSENALNGASGDMGAIKGRFNEFMTGKVGTTNKEWISLRTNVKLLETRLMQMHVGARGGEYILKHFENIFAYGYQSPENMRTALKDVRTYANEVNKSSFSEKPGDASDPYGIR